MARAVIVPIYLREAEDRDLIEVIERMKAEGKNISEIGREALRLYFGLMVERKGEVGAGVYRVAQLEKRLEEMRRDLEDFKVKVLERRFRVFKVFGGV